MEPNLFDATRVAKGSIYLVLQQIISLMIGIFGIAFLARMITQREIGILTTITLIGSFINLASDFGLSSSLVKHVSELRGRNEDFSTHFFSSLAFKTPVSMLFCSVLFIFSGDISTFFSTSLGYELIILAAIHSFFISAAPLFNRLLLGTGHFKKIAISIILYTAIRWLGIFILIWLGYGLHGAVVGWIIGDLTILIMYMVFSRKVVSKGVNFTEIMNLIPEILKFSWPLYLSSMIVFLYTYFDRALIIAFLSLQDLGVYEVTLRAYGVLTSIATSLGSSLFPYYGMAYGRSDHIAVGSGIKRASKYTMIIIFPLALGLLSTAKPVMLLFAGQSYEEGWFVLTILAAFGLVRGVSTPLTNLLLIYKKRKTLLFLNLVPVIISLTMIPLLWIFYLPGLALMKGASLIVTFLLSVKFLSKSVDIKIDRQIFMKTLVSSVFMALIVLCIQQIYYDILLLPLYILLGALAYFSCMRLFRILDREDMKLLKNILGERTTKYFTFIFCVDS
jgi:O-antigen/teichoic acid export membrane protein